MTARPRPTGRIRGGIALLAFGAALDTWTGAALAAGRSKHAEEDENAVESADNAAPDAGDDDQATQKGAARLKTRRGKSAPVKSEEREHKDLRGSLVHVGGLFRGATARGESGAERYDMRGPEAGISIALPALPLGLGVSAARMTLTPPGLTTVDSAYLTYLCIEARGWLPWSGPLRPVVRLGQVIASDGAINGSSSGGASPGDDFEMKSTLQLNGGYGRVGLHWWAGERLILLLEGELTVMKVRVRHLEINYREQSVEDDNLPPASLQGWAVLAALGLDLR